MTKSTWGKIYLSGPMTGIPDHNFPAFNEATKSLRSQGYDVVNPAENDGGQTDKSWDYYIRLDIKSLADCNSVVLLPGWERSKGARLEVHIAKELNMPILLYPTLESYTSDKIAEWDSRRESIIEEAYRLVNGDRQNQYGSPGDDFKRLAARWSQTVGNKIDYIKALLMMIDLKLNRLTHKVKRDSLVDLVGYALCLERVLQEEHKKDEFDAKYYHGLVEAESKISKKGVGATAAQLTQSTGVNTINLNF